MQKGKYNSKATILLEGWRGCKFIISFLVALLSVSFYSKPRGLNKGSALEDEGLTDEVQEINVVIIAPLMLALKSVVYSACLDGVS